MSIAYGFDEQLAISDGHVAQANVRDVMLELIPGAMNVSRAANCNDRNGTDWWVEVHGRHLSVDAKVRSSDWALNGKDDLALETYSVKGYSLVDGTRTSEPTKCGWTRDESKRSDYILWLWTDSGRYCLIAFPYLCRVFQEKWQDWSSEFGTSEQFTPSRNGDRAGWYSECVFVPRRVVWREIYLRFSPNPLVEI